MVTTRDIIIGAAAVAAVSSVGYLIWFDQKRQRDPKFRKQLKAQARKAREEKNLAENRARIAREREESRAAMGGDSIDTNGPIPEDPEARQEYFMKLLQYGESLAVRGPQAYPLAAAAFFKAIQAYHDPMNLLMVLQQSLPGEIMQLIMELYAADLKRHQKEYFEHFPPAEQNVKMVPVATSATKKRRALIVTKDIKAGEEIFHEDAVVSIPVSSSDRTVCAYCISPIAPSSGDAEALHCGKCKVEHYCSAKCQSLADDEYHSVLCVSNEASKALADYCAAKGTAVPLLVARFLMKMVKEENKKKAGKTTGAAKYSEWDHLERLFDLPRKVTESVIAEAAGEVQLLRAAIAPSVPGFEEFLTVDRYTSIKGKFLYNIFGIPSSTSEVGVPQAAPSHDTPRGPPAPIALAHYRTSPMIAHNCTPSAAMTHKGDSASVVASRDLAMGEEVTIDWADVSGMDTAARRKVLKERFAFFCRCETCAPIEEA
ncbi:hypothetical protein HDU90_002438 [Geranomyces variabilis]|nr:hypothetical protein HDU90_002438 [Geranomyces variabilis]